jgi:predicted MPP superfamily phosphohydrolase
MRLQLISDLHTEFWRGKELAFVESLPIEKGLDFLVVAGDLVCFGAQGSFIIEAIFATLSHMARHVLYVFGNHEYYGCSKEFAEAALRPILAKYPNIRWLDNESLTLDGVHFVGGSMWYPNVDGLNQLYKRLINDAYQIKGFDWAERENAILNTVVNTHATPETIVITHHLPHASCTPPVFRAEQSNRFFVSNQYFTMVNNRPKLWLFGHTHTPCDILLESTRMVCNPKGYPGENMGAYPQVVFDV